MSKVYLDLICLSGCMLVLIFYALQFCSNTGFQFSKYTIGDIFNLAAFKEGESLSILLNILISLVFLWLNEEQLLHKLVKGLNIKRALQNMILHHIEEQLVMATLKITVWHH